MERRRTLPEMRKNLSRKERVTIFMKTDGRCYKCGQKLETKGWDAEHTQALELLGPSDIDALLPICKPCHKIKTAGDRKAIAKCNRVRDKHIGAVPKKQSRQSKYRKKMDGTVVWRETGERVK
jgi:hypothetical protein